MKVLKYITFWGESSGIHVISPFSLIKIYHVVQELQREQEEYEEWISQDVTKQELCFLHIVTHCKTSMLHQIFQRKELQCK